MSREALDAAIKRLGQEGITIGLALYLPDSRTWTGRNEDRFFPLASVAKLLIAGAALARGAGTRDQVRAAVSHHDRPATEALLSAAGGVDPVNAWLAAQGVDCRVGADQQDRRRNVGTPRGVATFLRRLSEGELLGPGGRATLLSALAGQEDPDGLLAGLPPGSAWAHMTGGFAGVCNDAGILSLPGQEVICCALAQGDPEGEWSRLHRALGTVGGLVFAAIGR